MGLVAAQEGNDGLVERAGRCFLDSLQPFIAPPGACAPIYAVGDYVEFQLPGRAFTVYAFGEVRRVIYAPLYGIVTPAANYHTVSGGKVRMRDTTESLSSQDESTLEWVATQGDSASPEYQQPKHFAKTISTHPGNNTANIPRIEHVRHSPEAEWTDDSREWSFPGLPATYISGYRRYSSVFEAAEDRGNT